MTATPAEARPDAPLAPRSAVVGLVLAAVGTVLAIEALGSSDQPTRAVVWASLALAAWAFGLMCLAGAAQGNRLGLAQWRFGPWTLLWYGAAFGLASITFSQPQTGIASQIALSSVLRALWLVGVGTTVWVVGYFVGPGRPMRTVAVRGIEALGRRFTAEVRGPAAPWVLYAIGSAARIASTLTSGIFGYVGDASSAVTTVAGYGQILTLLSLCAPLAVAASALQVFREQMSGARLTLTVLFLIELTVGLAAGNKQNFIIVALAVIIPYSAARRRLPKVMLALAILLFLLIIVPFTGTYRNTARGGTATLTASQAIHAAPEILLQTVTGQNVFTVLSTSSDYLLQRIREIDSPAIIVQRTPQQIHFLSPAQLVEAPLTELVPRAIWPGKPIVATGYSFNQQYYGLPPTLYTSAATTPIGGLYQYGGWIPVIGGMFLLGCGVRLLDEVLDVRTNTHSIFLVLLMFPDIVKGEQGWVDLLAAIPGTICIWLLAVALTFRHRTST